MKRPQEWKHISEMFEYVSYAKKYWKIPDGAKHWDLNHESIKRFYEEGKDEATVLFPCVDEDWESDNLFANGLATVNKKTGDILSVTIIPVRKETK